MARWLECKRTNEWLDRLVIGVYMYDKIGYNVMSVQAVTPVGMVEKSFNKAMIIAPYINTH